VLRDPALRDRLTYSATGSGAFDLSPRWHATVNESWQTNYADEVTALALQGVLLRTILARTNYADGALAYRLTERTSLTADARHEIVSFRPQGGLVGSTRVTGTLGATHRTSPRRRQRLRGLPAAERGGPGRAWDRGRRGLGARVRSAHDRAHDGGPPAVRDPGHGGETHRAFASALVEGHHRHGLFTADYSHSLAPGYEDGRDRILDVATLAGTDDLGPRFALFGSLSAGRRRDLDPGDCARSCCAPAWAPPGEWAAVWICA